MDAGVATGAAAKKKALPQARRKKNEPPDMKQPPPPWAIPDDCDGPGWFRCAACAPVCSENHLCSTRHANRSADKLPQAYSESRTETCFLCAPWCTAFHLESAKHESRVEQFMLKQQQLTPSQEQLTLEQKQDKLMQELEQHMHELELEALAAAQKKKELEQLMQELTERKKACVHRTLAANIAVAWGSAARAPIASVFLENDQGVFLTVFVSLIFYRFQLPFFCRFRRRLFGVFVVVSLPFSVGRYTPDTVLCTDSVVVFSLFSLPFFTVSMPGGACLKTTKKTIRDGQAKTTKKRSRRFQGTLSASHICPSRKTCQVALWWWQICVACVRLLRQQRTQRGQMRRHSRTITGMANVWSSMYLVQLWATASCMAQTSMLRSGF